MKKEICLGLLACWMVGVAGERRDTPVYGGDSDNIDARIAEACQPGGSRTVTLGRNPQREDGVWMTTRAILLPDDFTLVLDNCRVELAPGTRDNIIRNAGALGYRRITPNRNIKVLGKGDAVLCGGKSNHFAPTRSGDWNGWRSMGILFASVTGYELAGFTMEETQCWGISQESGCSRGRVHDIRFRDTNKMLNQDGIDVRKGCHDIVIENISGVCGDDMVALTGIRKPTGTPQSKGFSCYQISGCWPEADDDIHDIVIRNIRARSSGGNGIIRLLTQDGIKMHHITISNVVETADVTRGEPTCKGTLRVGDTGYWSIRCCEMGEMRDIVIRDVKSASKVGVLIRGKLADSSILGVTVPSGAEKYKIVAPIRNVSLDEGEFL